MRNQVEAVYCPPQKPWRNCSGYTANCKQFFP